MMTEQHPLTDEQALGLLSFEQFIDTYEPTSAEDAMRTAADWQLEQVVEWLRHNLDSVPLDPVGYSGYTIDVAYVIEDLREAMRPTQVAIGREGALQALDRLYEENFDGLKRLAQEDD